MKIFAFTDNHGEKKLFNKQSINAVKSDIVISAGDLTLFGKKQKEMLEFFDTWSRPVFVIHGNHELEEELKRDCEKTKNVIFIHNQIVEIEDLVIIGHGGGGFSSRYPDFDENMSYFSEAVRTHKKSVVVFHAPPYGTKLDVIGNKQHVGSKSYREFIEFAQPDIVICGHIHETFYMEDKIGKTKIFNVGPEGRIIDI